MVTEDGRNELFSLITGSVDTQGQAYKPTDMPHTTRHACGSPRSRIGTRPTPFRAPRPCELDEQREPRTLAVMRSVAYVAYGYTSNRLLCTAYTHHAHMHTCTLSQGRGVYTPRSTVGSLCTRGFCCGSGPRASRGPWAAALMCRRPGAREHARPQAQCLPRREPVSSYPQMPSSQGLGSWVDSPYPNPACLGMLHQSNRV